MKILHVINTLGGGGRERRMAQTAKSLRQLANVDQAVIVFRTDEAYQEINDAQLIIKKVNGCRRVRIRKYSKFIKTFKPDIVHLWIDTPTEAIYFSLAKKIYHYKLVLGFVADGNPISGFNTYHLGVRLAFRKADIIVSNSMAGLIAKKAPLKRSLVIANGFDFNRFHPIDRSFVRTTLGVSDEFLVVMCASMTMVKDWQSFFRTAQQAELQHLNAKFICVGGGELFDKYQELVTGMNLKNLKLLGKRNDVESILQAADMSMLFTNNELHAEGVSNSIMEAMAAGLPVIATEGGGTREIIDDGVNGFVIEPRNYNQALGILKTLMDNPEKTKEIGRRANNTIRTKFCFEDKAKEYLTLYKKLIG